MEGPAQPGRAAGAAEPPQCPASRRRLRQKSGISYLKSMQAMAGGGALLPINMKHQFPITLSAFRRAFRESDIFASINRDQSLQKIILFNLFARLASLLLNFAAVLLLARWLGPASKGYASLLMTSITLVSFVSNVFCGQSNVYLRPRQPHAQLLLPSYLWAFLICALSVPVCAQIKILPESLRLFIPLCALLTALLNTHQTFLLGSGRFKAYNINLIFNLCIQTAVFIFLCRFLSLRDIASWYIALCAGLFSSFVLSIFQLRPQIAFSRLQLRFRRALSGFLTGLRFQLVEVLAFLNLRFYFYLLFILNDAAKLGVYSVGISILESVWLLSRSMATYVISDASNHKEDKPQEVFSLIRVAMLFSFAALVFLYLLPGEVYSYAFGNQFRHIKYSVRFLFPGIWMYSMIFVLEAWLLGKGRTRLLITANALGAVVSAALCYLLIPRFVMSGAGLAATVAFTLTGLFLFFGFCRINRLSPLEIFDWAGDVDIFRERWNRWRGRIG